MIEDLLKKWNIGQIDTINPTPEGIGKNWFVKTISDRDFVLKASSLAKAERKYRYRLALSKTEIPVALPIMTMDGEWFVENDDDKVYFLSPKLPGNIVAEHYSGDAHKRARNFGRAIGLLHVCFLEINDVSNYREMDLVGQVQGWVIPTIRKNEKGIDTHSTERIWKDAEVGLMTLCNAVQLQLIHRDAHPSNMLFDAGKLTGFLDFEMVTRGQRIFDVCYCGSSILVSGFEDRGKAEKWPAIFQSLIEGYQEYCSLTLSEYKYVYEVLIAIELIFMAFWLDYGNIEEAEKVKQLSIWLEKHRYALEI